MAAPAEEREVRVDHRALRAFRTRRLWTQEELAAAAVLSDRTVQRAEAGKPVSIETLRGLAAALDVPSARLLVAAPIAPGLLWGGVCGATGIAMGMASAIYGILAGNASGAEAGVAFGLVGAVGGAAFAWLSIAINARRRAGGGERARDLVT